ncbi:hypothetical protein [Candidatus Poriferisocius sp.]|uniref:hypothetical protein n=1 Tax=Candidatus Poriferisocius sp. TaxID=3101276 RepID=UPI003B018C97
MDTLTLADLGPIIAAIMGPMLLFAAASMRYQHIDSTKTRGLTRDLIEHSNKELRDLIERTNRENREMIAKNRDLIEDTRQRCARIEGHLRIAPPPDQTPETGSDAEAA